MNVSQPFIERPVATTLLMVGIVLLGLLGYRLLPVAMLPSVEFPTIQVTSRLPGASPEVMASSVTTPLEHQLGQISGLSSMSSTSAYATSRITLSFSLSRDIEAAAQDVQAAINAASALLPLRLMPSPPTYAKVNPADAPVIVLALTSDELPLNRLSDLADTNLVQKLSQVDGTGLVTIEGGQKKAVRLQADPSALAGLGLSLADIRETIARATVNLPKGGLDGPRQSFQVAADDQLFDVDAYAETVIAHRNDAPVRLRDVARVVDGIENETLAGWANGKPAVILNIQRQPGANIIAVVDGIRRLLPQLQAALPPAVQVSVLSDRTETIRASIAEVQHTLVLTVGLVVLVIFVFLRTLWATLIPAVTLPVSLVATFGIMALCGYTLDNLSLMALTIAAGFVVDDAIVMIENIVRHLERGEAPLQAALKGAREIGFTVISLTVSLIAVFLPLLLMGGVVGRLFREFAVTLSVAVSISALVSLTLVPMMCARLLAQGDGPDAARPSRLMSSVEQGFTRLVAGYETGLARVLRHRRAVLAATVLLVGATVYLYAVVPKGFMPQQDTGLLLGVVDAAPDIAFAAMQARQRAVAERVERDPAVASVSSVVGGGTANTTGNAGRLYVTLKPRGEREQLDRVLQRLRTAADGIPGVAVYFQAAQDIQLDSRAARTQYQYALQSADPAELALWAPRFVAALRQHPELADVASDQQSGGLQAMVRVDREVAARYGVEIQAIDDALYDAFGQRQIATIYTQQNQYHVILEVDPAFRADPAALGSLYVRGRGDALVRLTAVASLELGTAPLLVTHEGLFPAVTLSFNVPAGASLDRALEALHATERAIGLPRTIATQFVGSAAEFRRSLQSQGALILAAIVVVYIVLGVLYESAIHPVTILSTLPSAGVGALLALMATGHALDVISLIGIILLIGIVKKNAIMMIDFALEAERGGASREEAITQACILRFRPIMMTTMAALFGALPLALGTGIGAELRRPLGIAIIGGLVVSQVLTLYTTPVIYLAFARLETRLKRRLRRREPAPAGPPAPETASVVEPPPGQEPAWANVYALPARRRAGE